MISLGLSAGDQSAFEADLLEDHRAGVLVQALDMDHNVVGEASGSILSGQVDVDVTGDVSRSCSLEIRDPDHALNLDSGTGPAEAGSYADRMVQVHYRVHSKTLGRWVNVPVFTGPITTLKRSEDTLSLTAQGKESFLQSGQNRWWSFPAGTLKTNAIKQVLADSGEQFSEITRWSDKLTTPTTITSSDAPWPVLKQLANSLASRSRGSDPVLFYNGVGYVRLRSFAAPSQWTFRRGVDFTTEPDLSFDLSAIRNIVAAHGAKGTSGSARLAASDPMSAQSLARNNVPRWLLEVISNDGWKSNSACAAAAKKRLDQLKSASVQIDLETVCIPHLEERDVVTVDNGTWSWRMQLQKFSIPLDGSSTMQIGRTHTTRKVTRKTKVARKGPRRR